MGVFETIRAIWQQLQGVLQWIVPVLIIFIIIVILANISRGWKHFIMNIKEVFSSKWTVFILFIILFLFAVFWNDFRESIGW